MTKGKRITLNEKPLSRKEAIALVASEGIFHEYYSDILTDKIDDRIVELCHVYSLTGNRILYINDVNGKYGGKGNIFDAVHFDKFVSQIKRMKDDIANGRDNNIRHWHFYSKYKNELINNTKTILADLSAALHLNDQNLNLTPASLDILSEKITGVGIDTTLTTLYDHLVVYIGEVIRKNAKKAGDWKINENFSFPVIATNDIAINYNPINIVWEELTAVKDPDFRKAYGKELRNVGSQLNSSRLTNLILG